MDVAQGLWEQAFLTSEREKGRTLLDVLTRGGAAAENDLTADEKNQGEHPECAGAEAFAAENYGSIGCDARCGSAGHSQPAIEGCARCGQRVSRARVRSASGCGKASRRSSVDHACADSAVIAVAIDRAVLEYEVAEDATYLFVLTRGANGPVLHGYTIGVCQVALSKRFSCFHKWLISSDPGFAVAAASLYQLLIAPAAKDLVGKTRLIIVPSAELWHLPFQALQGLRSIT